MRLYSLNSLRHFAHTSSKLYRGSNSAKFGLDFCDPSHLCFRNGPKYRKSKSFIGSSDDWTMYCSESDILPVPLTFLGSQKVRHLASDFDSSRHSFETVCFITKIQQSRAMRRWVINDSTNFFARFQGGGMAVARLGDSTPSTHSRGRF